jgi:hypothetical protein
MEDPSDLSISLPIETEAEEPLLYCGNHTVLAVDSQATSGAICPQEGRDSADYPRR